MKQFFFIACLFIGLNASAQNDTHFLLVKVLPVQVKAIATDNLDNLYLLTNTDQLKKYNAAGDSVAVYNEVRRFGKLHALDVSNPLRPVLFYKDFSTINLLDQQLSVRNTIDLRKYGIAQASAAGLSYDNNLWVFDALENKLKKLDEQGNLLLETIDFRTFLSETFLPEKIIDHDNAVYLYDPNAGLLQFDYYGSLQKKIPITHWDNLTISGKNIMGIHQKQLVVYQASNLMQRQYNFPSSFGSFEQYYFSHGKFFGLAKDTLNIYRFRF